MSLVIARKMNQQLFMIGDSKITNELTKGNSKVTDLITKIVIHENFAIAFAGLILPAQRVIEDIRSHDLEESEILEKLFEVHKKNENAVEFLLGSHENGSNFSLWLIKDGEKSLVETGWIGDYEGFAKYQGYYTGEIKAEEGVENVYHTNIVEVPEDDSAGDFKKSFDSITNLINCSDVSTVGNFVIPVFFKKGRFVNGTYASSTTHPMDFSKLPKEFTVTFSSADLGGYTYELATSNESPNQFAIYFWQPRLGVYFDLETNGITSVHIEKEVSPVEFTYNLNKKFSTALSSWFRNGPLTTELGKKL
jgi:hypothetical protein